MTDPTYLPAGGDGGPDDLPRTLRREREAREREARERSAAHAVNPPPSMSATYGVPEQAYVPMQDDQVPAARVTRLDVPFHHLVWFFIKAALAAIPGILLLGAILWVAGHLAQSYFPQLIKLQVLIWFPNNP